MKKTKINNLILYIIFFLFQISNLISEEQNINTKVVDLYRNGKSQEAIETAKKGLTQFVLNKQDTSPDSILLMVNLGIIYKKLNELNLAESYLQTALKYQVNITINSPLVGRIYKNLIEIKYLRSGVKFETPSVSNNMLIQEDDFNNTPDFSDMIFELANYYQKQNNFDKAESLYKKAINLMKVQEGDVYNKIGELYLNCGKFYLNQKKIKDAEPYFLQAFSFYEKKIDDINRAYALDNLGLINSMKNKFSESESFYRLSLEQKEKLLGKKNIEYAQTLISLGNVYSIQNKIESESVYLQALEIYVSIFGVNNQNVGHLLNTMAVFYKKVGRNEESNKFLKRSKEILSKK